MPKKTKAQKLRAQQRQSSGGRQVTTGGTGTSPVGPRMAWGRYLGLRFLLHATPVEANHTGDDGNQAGESCADEQPAASGLQDVALLCIDELRDGIIKVFFERLPVEELDRRMREAPFPWLPADRLQAARVIAYGQRINDYIGKAPPDNFADFLARLGELPEVSLPPGVFFCPVSDDPLPGVYAEQIKKNALGGVDAYYISDRAQRKQLGARHPRYALPQHVRYRTAMLESERLTWRPEGWDTPVRAIPLEGIEDAVGLALTQDLVRGTVFSIERHIADAAVPNPFITDADVEQALLMAQTAAAAGEDPPLEHPSASVAFILQAIDEGLALCRQIHRENVEREMEAAVVVRAFDGCLQNLRRPRGVTPGPRAYIEYLALTLR
ncbi:hypothetical protein [Chloracidobacterium thermophilum]|jgi:hypothetical protein|uniref:Uncharacterized protein n=1 Tax=Chloracidobacterium thermophilum (strain B) TaxID=981222 RepID=G2LKX7_CHLTF|nr:hypothetical protein [Chloracidobacterium thermophilum]AEP13332.1 hypothetical protein Cabther_B0330 [Chloracidobacterium thermophilum B]QUV80613.1 hypothetical protein J8C08_13575 [Chloracidobacterium thermophilum]